CDDSFRELVVLDAIDFTSYLDQYDHPYNPEYISYEKSYHIWQVSPADFEFSLRDAPTQILLPYVHKNTNGMHICYAYNSSTEVVSVLFALEYNIPPVELSTQQIADEMPKSFNYAQRKR
ncbi:hypothetical protein H5410_039862, partial [Solanum commersonii]